jgi:hypothetical protein
VPSEIATGAAHLSQTTGQQKAAHASFRVQVPIRRIRRTIRFAKIVDFIRKSGAARQD